MSKRQRKPRVIIVSWKLIFRLVALACFLMAGIVFFIAVWHPSPIQVSNVKNIASFAGFGVFFLLLAEFADDLF